MANKQWAVIISGGYNNSDSKSGTDTSVSNTGYAYLFVIFLKGPTGAGGAWTEGTDYIRIPTNVGSVATPNGLGDPFAADAIGADGLVDFVYAGDLQGNLWKFDLTSTTIANWRSNANEALHREGCLGQSTADHDSARRNGASEPARLHHQLRHREIHRAERSEVGELENAELLRDLGQERWHRRHQP